MKSKFFSLLFVITVALETGNAQEVNKDELMAYALKRHHVDFRAQTEKSKKEILNEYLQNAKLSTVLENGPMKDNIDFKIAARILMVELWANKFMQSALVSENDLKSLYVKLNPKTLPAYKLRGTILATEAEADSLIKTLESIKNKDKRMEKISNSQHKESDWIDLNKIDLEIQNQLKTKKENEIIKIKTPKNLWQVILIEDIKPERIATLEEAKARLTVMIKQEMLQKEIKKLLENK